MINEQRRNCMMYGIWVDIDIMLDDNMSKDEIEKWFKTPCEENPYFEDIEAGEMTKEEYFEMVDEVMRRAFSNE